jgi:ABC-type molybdate transport system substrate-binding protein
VPDGDVWAERPEVHLSSGAMLKPGIDQTVKQFAQREGITINTTYQGCGHLVDQMKAMRRGDARPALFPDAYFACDTSFMEMVQGWFDTSIVIARNDMVLVVQKGNPKQVRSISDLARGELFIGLGHPRNSALGKLTDDMLKKLGLHERVYAGEWQKRIIHADAGHDLVNKMRAAAGKLDAAIVYRSNAISNPENPAKYLDVIDLGIAEAVATQPFAVARDSPHRYLMKRLLAAILSPQTEARFRDAGFQWVYQSK